MRRLIIVFVGVMAILAGGAAWMHAQQSAKPGTLSTQDYIDIYQLYGY